MSAMLSSLAPAAAGTGFTFLMTTLGAATVFFFIGAIRDQTRYAMNGFAAGVMTAASVWSLLLPAIEQAQGGSLPAWLPASAGLLIGALFLTGMDLLIPRFRKSSLSHQNALLMTAITLHNIPEGMAVGLAFAVAADGKALLAASTLALGIGIQNFPEGAAISLPLRQEGVSRFRSFLYGTLSGVVEPIFGLLAVLLAAFAAPLMPWLLSFAAGAMLYVVADELIPQSRGGYGVYGFFAGFVLMMILDVALG